MSPLTRDNTGGFGSSYVATGGLSGGLMLPSVTSGDGGRVPSPLMKTILVDLGLILKVIGVTFYWRQYWQTFVPILQIINNILIFYMSLDKDVSNNG